MTVFLIVLFGVLVVYLRAAMQLPTLPPDETDDGDFNSLRLLSEPSFYDTHDASERMWQSGTTRETESNLQHLLWPILAFLLVFVWWRVNTLPVAPSETHLTEKVAPLPVAPAYRPWLPAAVRHSAVVPTETPSVPEEAVEQSIALPDSQLQVLPGFILKLAEYSQSDGALMLGTVFPTEHIESLHVGPEEYWAGIFCKTYGEAQRVLKRWERCRAQWERYGIRPEIIQLQGA